MKTSLKRVFGYDLASIINDALRAAEQAEQGLAIDETQSNIDHRKATGSFYTPIDVVEHFWEEYFRFHDIKTRSALLSHLADFTFVEPAVGAGVFLFGLLKKIYSVTGNGADLEHLKFLAIDINRPALAFITGLLDKISTQTAIKFPNVAFVNSDFRSVSLPSGNKIAFVGNPPYVRNSPGARWKNLYADFFERMLDESSEKRSIALIVPLSVAFSRDYASLRKKMRTENRAIRLESFDNIPDSLFKTGKPGNLNTNKANSQRCCIVMLRNHGPARCDATDLRRWSRKDRANFLGDTPQYIDIGRYAFDEQIPRPSCQWIIDYLAVQRELITIGDLLCAGSHGFSVAGVGRNFIGLRESANSDASSLALSFSSQEQMLWALQIIASPVFYEYWRTVGDGFHVTKSDVTRFPISINLLSGCIENQPVAARVWRKRKTYERQKINSGKPIKSYDFRGCFDRLVEDARCIGTVKTLKSSSLSGVGGNLLLRCMPLLKPSLIENELLLEP